MRSKTIPTSLEYPRQGNFHKIQGVGIGKYFPDDPEVLHLLAFCFPFMGRYFGWNPKM